MKRIYIHKSIREYEIRQIDDISKDPMGWRFQYLEVPDDFDEGRLKWVFLNGESILTINPVTTSVEIPVGVPDSPVTIDEVSMAQARLALLARGKLNEILPIINSLPSPQKEQALIEWEFRTVVKKSSDLVKIVAEGLNMTEEDTDLFFKEASLL